MCGEHADRAGVGAVGAGSSPHVRGARNATAAESPSSGIIPACAGSTESTLKRLVIRGDHPRMCGEHVTVARIHIIPSGSSPHVRGARRAGARPVCGAGIIPACAGSTVDGGKPCQWRRDHPRMCGEHVDRILLLSCARGSSPHVRGAR